MNFSMSGMLSNLNMQSNDTSKAAKVGVNSAKIAVSGQSEIAKLINGSQITGEVIKVSGKEVVIQIGPNQQITAKMVADCLVDKGSIMTFEVNKNANGQIALRALFANMDIHPTALKALDMADLAVNEKSVQMVECMMKDGMNIDSQSLQKMYQEIVKNPEASGETIVALKRLQIPVTPANINQFEVYSNLKHQISGAVDTIAMQGMELTHSLIQKGDFSSAVMLQQHILDSFVGSDVNWISGLGNEASKVENNNSINIERTPLKQSNEQVLSKGFEILEQKEFRELLELSKNLGFSEEVLGALEKGEVSSKQFLSLMNQVIGSVLTQGSEQDQAILKKILFSPSYEKLVVSHMKEELSFKPEDLFEKEKVKQLYDRIQVKMEAFTQTLQGMGGEADKMLQSVNQLQQNVQFMDQLNQFANYIQLPLQMNGKDTNGELYVYSNKKNMANSDGTLSAFLHLDMTHLGAVDVYVALKNTNAVNTHFYLSSDEMIDFMSKHMDILTERLKKRGYDMSATISEKAEHEPFQVMEEIKKEQNKNGMVGNKIATYAFDVRA